MKLTILVVLPGQNKMSGKYERIRGGNVDFNSAQTCFRFLFRTFYSVLVITSSSNMIFVLFYLLLYVDIRCSAE